jgi:hypothetical protein
VRDLEGGGVGADEDVRPVVVAPDTPDLDAVRAGRASQRGQEVVADDGFQEAGLLPLRFLPAFGGVLFRQGCGCLL